MKRLLWVGTVAAGLAAYLIAASCSNPLETMPEPEPPQIVTQIDTLTVCDTIMAIDTVFVSDSGDCTDTLFVTDTLVVTDTVVVTDSVIVPDSVLVTDTVLVIDTLMHTDTLLVLDTVFHTDTVIVVERDTSGCGRMCDQLSSTQKEIVWLLDNTAGRYRLDFSGWVERDQPPQKLILYIDGDRHEWVVAENSDLTVEADLGLHAKIFIKLDNPKACGHEVAVCLTVTPI